MAWDPRFGGSNSGTSASSSQRLWDPLKKDFIHLDVDKGIYVHSDGSPYTKTETEIADETTSAVLQTQGMKTYTSRAQTKTAIDDPEQDPSIQFDPNEGKYFHYDEKTAEKTYLPTRQPSPENVEAAYLIDYSLRGHKYAQSIASSSGTQFESVFDRLSIRDTASQLSSRPASPQKLLKSSAWPRPKGHLNDTGSQILDPRFIVQPEPCGFFVRGRVFKVFWPELAGVGDGNSSVGLPVNSNLNDVRIFGKIRLFVVIRSGHGSSTCLPISSYDGRGVSKPGIIKAHHSMVYTERQPPPLLSGEVTGQGEEPMRPAIRILPSNKGDKLPPTARLNYGKMYTVEHNVQVYDFGMVRSEYIPILAGEWRSILEGTIGQKRASRTKKPTKRSPSSIPNYVDYGYATKALIPSQGDDRQITLEEGDRLAILAWPFEGWARAYNENSRDTGLVPESCVTLYPSCTANYDWRPTSSEGHQHIEVRAGDDIRVIGESRDGWALVWNQRTAYTGLVPSDSFTLSNVMST